MADKVRFERLDLFETSLADATVVTLYLLPGIVTKLVPKILAEMRPGTRVVAHDYPLAPWKEDRFVQFDAPEKEAISGTTRTVLYLYTVPARVAGEWRLELPAALRKQPAPLTLTRLTILLVIHNHLSLKPFGASHPLQRANAGNSLLSEDYLLRFSQLIRNVNFPRKYISYRIQDLKGWCVNRRENLQSSSSPPIR